MKDPMRILQGLKLAAVLAVALSIGACAKNPLADGAMASAADLKFLRCKRRTSIQELQIGKRTGSSFCWCP